MIEDLLKELGTYCIHLENDVILWDAEKQMWCIDIDDRQSGFRKEISASLQETLQYLKDKESICGKETK